ncbi:unnamed protein product [Caretta caretta]
MRLVLWVALLRLAAGSRQRGPSAQNTTWPGLQENTTRSEPRRRGLPPHHWTIQLLALGAGLVLTAAVVLCLPRRRGRENRE